MAGGGWLNSCSPPCLGASELTLFAGHCHRQQKGQERQGWSHSRNNRSLQMKRVGWAGPLAVLDGANWWSAAGRNWQARV